MMFDFLEEILNELKDIPGLNFLKNLRESLMLKSSRLGRRARDLNTRKNSITQATKSLGKLTRSSKGAKRRET